MVKEEAHSGFDEDNSNEQLEIPAAKPNLELVLTKDKSDEVQIQKTPAVQPHKQPDENQAVPNASELNVSKVATEIGTAIPSKDS